MPRKKNNSESNNKKRESNEDKENVKQVIKKKKKTQAKLSDEEFKTFTHNISNEIVSRFGLDLIGLNSNDIRSLVEEIINSIAESRVTKPSEESLIKKFINMKDQFMKSIAARLVENDEINSRERLEFVITYYPELAGRATPKLYQLAKKFNAIDLIDNLRQLWNTYGKPTPIRCPVCGFNSVTPDLVCVICGSILDEKDIKKDIDFKNQVLKLKSVYSKKLIEEIINSGYVIFDGEIKPPSLQEKDKISIVLHLSKDEKEALLKNLGNA